MDIKMTMETTKVMTTFTLDLFDQLYFFATVMTVFSFHFFFLTNNLKKKKILFKKENIQLLNKK